ncbi:DNA/RNA non-specific endonuclease [Acinetobacter sp. MB5]|uniref:DNA/RNA non-specific endonuclease n=1 Tax=Acinetobacter sp. MB5 TaxID=2069438 RepID=UPI000DCFFDF7|nr:DNA/RNA non-specific endonuclease [Acinetobacter sp. MB5]
MTQKLNRSIQGLVLLCATGMADMAFAQDSCLSQFYQQTPPVLLKQSLNKNTFSLCFSGFSVMYSGVSKTALWSAEHLTVARLSQKIKREDQFHEEEQVPEQFRATLADYRGSGYDRGHMSPNADMPTKTSQYDSFSLANMVPQAPKNNQEVWRKLEEATRSLVKKQKQEVYVVTGPVFTGQRLKTIGKGKVIVPTAVFKAIYMPKTGVVSAYYAPNNNSQQVQVVSVCKIEQQTGLNLFPQLSIDQKRKVYDLPLTSTDVKAGRTPALLETDQQSECGGPSASSDIHSLQQSFGQAVQEVTQQVTHDVAKTVTQDGDNFIKKLLKALLDSVLEFLLKLFKS